MPGTPFTVRPQGLRPDRRWLTGALLLALLTADFIRTAVSAWGRWQAVENGAPETAEYVESSLQDDDDTYRLRYRVEIDGLPFTFSRLVDEATRDAAAETGEVDVVLVQESFRTDAVIAGTNTLPLLETGRAAAGVLATLVVAGVGG